MNKYDILTALEWLAWRLNSRNRKYSQGYLERMAQKQLRETAENRYVSDTVKQVAQAGITNQAPDKACIDLCKTILLEASEEDFLEMLMQNPGKITEWRKLWDGIRGNHIHRL